jgi:hypothetical protein
MVAQQEKQQRSNKEKGAGLAARTQRDDSSENAGVVVDDPVSPQKVGC